MKQCHSLSSLHQIGNKPASVHVRYRSVNRFFKWCVKEGEREDNPVDYIDPPRLPQVIEPIYEAQDVEAILKSDWEEVHLLPSRYRCCVDLVKYKGKGCRTMWNES